jgi:hypothetical protein
MISHSERIPCCLLAEVHKALKKGSTQSVVSEVVLALTLLPDRHSLPVDRVTRRRRSLT